MPAPSGLRLVEVGEATLTSNALFGDFLAPTDNALADAEVSPAVAAAAGYHRPAPPPLFLAEGVSALAEAPALARLYRSYAWVAPLEPGVPRLWEIDELAAGTARARSELQARTRSFDVVAPVEELRSAQEESRRAGHRLALVGGEAAVLLFAFAILAALTLRQDQRAARRRLAWAGARSWQLALLTIVEAGLIALAGTVLGFTLGLAGGALVAERAGAPVRDVLAQSILSRAGLVLVGAIALAAAAVLSRPSPRIEGGSVGAAWRRSTSPPSRPRCSSSSRSQRRRRGRSRPAAPGARHVRCGSRCGATPPPRPPSGRAADARTLARPALRDPLARAQSRLRDRGNVVPRRQLWAGAFRRDVPGDAPRGERDGAAYAVPRDFVVQEDLRRLIPVLDAAPLGRLRTLGPGTEVNPVLRATGAVGRQEGESGSRCSACRRPRWRSCAAGVRTSAWTNRTRSARRSRRLTGTAGSGSGSTRARS